MKKLLGLILLLNLIACKKGDTGPAGPAGSQGPAGPQGPTGVAGNANVKQYTFGSQNLASNSFVQLQVSTTQDTLNRSLWFVYLYSTNVSRWYSIPGIGLGGATQYRVSLGYNANKVNIYIDKSGPGEVYSQARVIRVYANSESPGGRMNSSLAVDLTDYNAVKRYYNLPD